MDKDNRSSKNEGNLAEDNCEQELNNRSEQIMMAEYLCDFVILSEQQFAESQDD